MRQIRLNKKFYTRKCVEAAQEEVKTLCKTKIKDESGEYIVEIEDTHNTQNIEYEFANICLAGMK
jgi:hypothetical protein